MSEFDKFFGCVKKTLLFHFEKECLSYLISKGLSIGIVLFSFTSKLPQILNMYKTKDIKGLSYLSIYLDVVSFLCSSLYPFHKGYAFLTYGENVIILLENILIFFMAWKYDIDQSCDRNNMLFTLIINGFLFAVFKEVLYEKAWTLVGNASTVLSMGSRLTQIAKSYKEKSTGPLSTITYALNMMGNVVRIFTTMKENKDIIMTAGFVISFFLNLIIFLQIIYYNRPKKDEKEIEREENLKEKDKNKNEDNGKDNQKSNKGKKKKKD
jgi:mannose-P-dolichol utilization defect protein 1